MSLIPDRIRPKKNNRARPSRMCGPPVIVRQGKAGQEWNTGTWSVGFTTARGKDHRWDQTFNTLNKSRP